MQEDEPDTFVQVTIAQKINELLNQININSKVQKIGTCEIEKQDYYGRYFSQSPFMVTNKGCLKLHNANIDMIQIIQKG